MDKTLEEYGTVISIEEETALVQFGWTSNCARCGLCRMEPGRQAMMSCRNPLGAVVGDRVRVRLGSAQLLGASAIVYLLPLLGAFIGYAAGAFFSETAGVVGSMLGVVITFLLIRRHIACRGFNLTSEIVDIVRD